MNFDSPHVRWSPALYLGLLVLAVVAFWPGYLSAAAPAPSGWTHFHAGTGTLWLLVLIVQPWAIRSGRRELHVWLGRATFVLAPAVVVGFIGLAHSSMQGKSPQGQAVDAYFLYVRVVLVATFIGCYIMGMRHRRDRELHSRYMICTGLALIDPVVHRIAQRVMGGADLNYQLLTFGIVCALLLLLIAQASFAKSGRRAFAVVLAWFVVGGIPLAFEFHTWGAPWAYWKGLSRQFVDLPLTSNSKANSLTPASQ